MRYLLLSLLSLLFCANSYAVVAPIVGPASMCVGVTSPISDATPGGTWSLSTTGVLSLGSGSVTAISVGVATITYSDGLGGYATLTVTVDPSPAPLTGPSTVCVGSTVALTTTSSGGTFSVSPTSYLSISSISGILTGVSPGVAVVMYTLPSTGCSTTTTVTVHPAPTPVTGPSDVCDGSTGAYSNPSSGGTWSTSNLAIGSIDPVTGVLMGLTAGTLTITYSVSGGCDATKPVTVNPLPAGFGVSGGGAYCVGGLGLNVITGGSDINCNYQLHRGGIPIGVPLAGTGFALDFGPQTIAGIYRVVATDVITGCSRTMSGSATVSLLPTPTIYSITGGGSYCAGGTGVAVGLSGSQSGVDYQLHLTGPVGSPVAGTGSAISFGSITSAGSYTVTATDATTTCTASMTGSAVVSITPSTTPSVTITATPGLIFCAGTTATFTAVPVSAGSAPTYQWHLNGVNVDTTISFSSSTLNSGDIIGVHVTSSDPCPTGPAYASVTVTIDTPIISAITSTACGGVYTLSATGGTSYTWTPATGLSCATCGTTTTIPGSTITYTVTGTDGACSDTATVTVDGNRISGHISYGGVSTDVFRVWLIQFDPTDSSIIASDSALTCMDGGAPYYEFMGAPAGSYMVKAMLLGGTPGTSGYIPTYSLTSANWFSATTVAHTSAADVMNISMIYGTVPSGPGFISGYVYSGAGKGTTGDAPEPGMIIYLKDLTNNTLTYTYTDATGAYSFGSLAYGNYIIYPESYKYYTTPSGSIRLSAASNWVTGVVFKKHTNSGIITPHSLACCTPVPVPGFSIYPNPAGDELNIAWGAPLAADADIRITDMAGRLVYSTTVPAATSTDISQLQLPGITEGLYMISVHAGNISYNGKLVIGR